VPARCSHLLTGAALALASGVLAVASSPASRAQVPPITVSPTTTTTAPASTTTTAVATEPAPGGGADPADPGSGSSTPAPPGATQDGDGGAPAGRIAVPPQAQRIIDSVHRTPANGSADLLAALGALERLGVPRDEALRVGMGRFPVAGPARYSHDWLYPRWGPGFRFHLGTDVFADHGTPVRSPVDGVARSSTSTLGGLSVKVHMPDGTYFYMAHLSGLAPGFRQGMPVQTGDIVGFVGDSGNARGGAPHVHFGVHPRGGPPVDPKPILDRFLAEAAARVPELVEHYQRRQQAAPAVVTAAPPRATLATAALRPLVSEATRPVAIAGALREAMLAALGPLRP
jgi:murein DD-endopeptidase MepM/ murein hydrolase activator NlpD